MVIPERQKKIILTGVILLSLALVYRLYPHVFLFFSEEQHDIKEQKIYTLHKKIEKKKQMEKIEISLKRSLAKLENGLLQGETESLAAVSIQSLLYDLGRQFDISIISVRVLKSKEIEWVDLPMYISVPIQVRLQLTVKKLENLLYAMARSSTLLVVSGLNIQVAKADKGKLLVTLTVQGVMMKNKDTNNTNDL